MLSRRSFLKLAWRLLLASVAIPAYATGVEAMGRPDVVTFRFTPPGWGRGKTMRIVTLADFHACTPWMTENRIAAICDQANALQPDLILLLGDYLVEMKPSLGPVPPEGWANALSRLAAPLGVHAILGNHDYSDDEAYQADATREPVAATVLKERDIAVYINDAVRLEKDGQAFWLAGLGDQLSYDGAGRIDDIEAVAAKITDDAPVILMAHEPDFFMRGDPRFNCVLSGHTHGGQINLFGWRPVAASRGSRIYPVGHYREEGRDLFVSRGLGCTGIPLRLGSWPEIMVIEIG